MHQLKIEKINDQIEPICHDAISSKEIGMVRYVMMNKYYLFPLVHFCYQSEMEVCLFL